MKKSNHFLFHAVLKSLRACRIQNQHLLVGVSGGLDSMTLLHVLWSLGRPLKLKLSVVHVHHGSEDKKQRAFQDKALKLVQSFCRKNHLPFYSNSPSKGGDRRLTALPQGPKPKSSADLRAFRYQVFLKYFKQSKAHWMVLAHTADDLLETRLLRLIRGTGPWGLKAMQFKRGRLLRPLIENSRSQIKDYALKTRLKWCEDPSNKSTEKSLRNWIRHKWLTELSAKKPGALKALSRSLSLLAHSKELSLLPPLSDPTQKPGGLVEGPALRRDRLLKLLPEDQAKIMACYLRRKGCWRYNLGHIKEILKQLARKQKNFSFFLLGKKWTVSERLLCIKNKTSAREAGGRTK